LLAYTAFLSHYYAPAISHPDANGYWAQGTLIAETGRATFRPESPLQYIGMHWLLTDSGLYVCRYPPGLPLAVALVSRLFGPEASVLLNPILALATLLGVFFLTRSLVGPGWGVLAALTLALNPVFNVHALNSISHMAVGALLDLRVFIVRNAAAEDVAKVVQNVFASTSSSQSGSARNQGDRLRFGPPEAGGAETVTTTATLKNSVKVAADAPTNTVVVMATAENLHVIGQLIKQLDEEAAATPQSVAIIPLENADPGDLAQVLADILTTDTQKVNLRRASRTTQTGQTQAAIQARTTTTGTTTSRTTTTLSGSTGSGGVGSTRTSTGSPGGTR
jgi:hypothetical protein